MRNEPEPREHKKPCIVISAAASTASSSPATRLLYRHALESIFGSLDLIGLWKVQRVCREWRKTIETMGTVKLVIDIVRPRCLSFAQTQAFSLDPVGLTSADLLKCGGTLLGRHIGEIRATCATTHTFSWSGYSPASVQDMELFVQRFAHLHALPLGPFVFGSKPIAHVNSVLDVLSRSAGYRLEVLHLICDHARDVPFGC